MPPMQPLLPSVLALVQNVAPTTKKDIAEGIRPYEYKNVLGFFLRLETLRFLGMIVENAHNFLNDLLGEAANLEFIGD